MPKDKKKNKKNEKIDTEIASLIKNTKKTEESELEKDVEEDFEEDLKKMEFHQFMQSSSDSLEGKAPVLERVAREAPRPIFVGGVPQGTRIGTDSKDEKDDSFKYVPSNAEKSETQYVESSTHIYHESERVDMNQIGRKPAVSSQTNQESFFTQSQEARLTTSQNPERAWRVDRFEVDKAGRKGIFERDQIKYEKYKPRTKL